MTANATRIVSLARLVGKIVVITTVSVDVHDGLPTMFVGRLVSLATAPLSRRIVGGVPQDFYESDIQATVEGGYGHSSYSVVPIHPHTTVREV